jgi:predicted dehydrogenase
VPIAIAAAQAGKHMYVEKPLGVSMQQDQAVRAAVKRYGVVFQFGTQQRSGRNFRFACELVRNGRIGELQTIHAWCPRGESGGSTTPVPVPAGFDYDMWLGPAPYAPYTEDRCAAETYMRKGTYHIFDYALGFIAGWGIHPLDIAQWGNGTDDTCPVEYEGTGTYPTEGLFDTCVTWDVRCRYANGVKIRFMSDDVVKPLIEEYHPRSIDHGTTFVGSEGWVSVDREGIYADPPSLLKSEIGPDEIHLYESNHHQQNLLDCIKSRSQTISHIDAAFQGDAICQLSEIAVRTGRKIRWDPKKEEIIGDDAASRLLTRPMRSPWHL